MKRLRRSFVLAVVALSVCALHSAAQTPATTAFTYQGRLLDSGSSPSATYDFQFKLFDALTGGSQVGSTIILPAVQVSGGLFTVSLDFGSQFNSQSRWLNIGVRVTGGGAFTPLMPRQPITAAPEANGLVLPMSATTGVSADALSLTNTVGGGLSATGAVNGIDCISTGVNGNGISAQASNGSLAYGVWGRSTSGFGVVGGGTNGAVGGLFSSDSGIGLVGQSTSTHAIYGENGAGSGRHPLFNYGTGVWGDTDNGNGVAGTSGTAFGVYGLSGPVSGLTAPGVAGILGESHNHLGVAGLSNSNNGVYGSSNSSSGVFGSSVTSYGTYGVSGAPSGLNPIAAGVWGDSQNGNGLTGTSASAIGVYGLSTTGWGIQGVSSSNYGVYGASSSSDGVTGLSSIANGVSGVSSTSNASGTGVLGIGHFTSGLHISDFGKAGVWGDSDLGFGVFGTTSASALGTGATAAGVAGWSNNPNGIGVMGINTGTSGPAWGVYGSTDSAAGFAGVFGGNVHVFQTLSKGGGSFKIDHPLDPENKYLYHSFVESPDMMNIYNGNVTTDAKGYATVTMPDWFQALNRDFRYQLTVVDENDDEDFVQAKIAKGVANNRFTLRTSRPNTTVSWQVTGVRQDAFANAHRIQVEEYKSEQDRGLFLHPAELGRPKELGIEWRMKRQMRQTPAPSQPDPTSSGTGASARAGGSASKDPPPATAMVQH